MAVANNIRNLTATRLILLWLAGASMRVAILSEPPMIPAILRELGLSQPAVLLLSILPVAMLVLAAVPGAALVAKLGARKAFVAGVLTVALGTAGRALISGPRDLYIATVLLGAGVGFLQPTVAVLVREWMPRRVAYASAVFVNGLFMGEVIAILAAPVIFADFAGGWRVELGAWSVPLLVYSYLFYIFAPNPPLSVAGGRARTMPWWPDWRRPLTWRLGLLSGAILAGLLAGAAALYLFLVGLGGGAVAPFAGVAVVVGQLPGSLLVLPYVDRLERQARPYVLAGAAMVVALLGLYLAPVAWPLWALLLGAAAGAAFTLCMTLPPLLAAAGDVGRVMAATCAIGFALALAAAAACWAAAEWSPAGATVLLPAAIGAVLAIVVALSMKRAGELS